MYEVPFFFFFFRCVPCLFVPSSVVPCLRVGGDSSQPSTMRCILGFCAAALPIAASFTAHSAVHPALPRQKQSSKDLIMFGRGNRRHRTRRYAGEDGPVNLDSSDDAPEADDEKIYASLRKRLEELEKSAPIVPAAEVEA